MFDDGTFVYRFISAMLLLILAALYFIKSFKESQCVARTSKKHSYVQTSSVHKPPYTAYPIQTQTAEYPPASHGYNSIGHTKPVQPPEYTETADQGKLAEQQPTGTNYFRPFKNGVGNVSDEPKQPDTGASKTPVKEPPAELSPKKESQVPATSASSSQDPSPEEKASPGESRDKAKPSSSSEDSGGLKLFGARKKDKLKEQVVPMVSSERSVEEDLEHYPEEKNPFDDDEDCEWDPNNRG